MERKLFNIVRPREGRNGQTYWDRHGILIVKDGRISLHLTSIPTGEWDGWFQAYAQDEQEQPAAQHRGNAQAPRPGNGGGARTPSPPAPDFDDDVPF